MSNIFGKLKLGKWVFSDFSKAATPKPTLVSQGTFRVELRREVKTNSQLL